MKKASSFLIIGLMIFAAFAFTSPNTTSSDEKITVIIDAGHGGNDSGNVEGHLQEKDIVLQIQQKLKENVKNYDNLELLFTCEGDESVSLDDRLQFIKAQKADYLVSLHINNSSHEKSVSGVELFINQEKKEESINFAAKLISAFTADLPFKKATIKVANFKVVRASQIPSILLEIGFMNNHNDAAFVSSSEGQTKIANNLLASLAKLKK